MAPYAVWETEYPEDGSNLVFAVTAKGARRRYRRMTLERTPCVADLVPLTVAALTTAQALALARSES